MSNVRCIINLFVLTNVYTICQVYFYKNQNSTFFYQINFELNFNEARNYCRSFENGELAVTKDRSLAKKIDEELSKQIASK